MFSEETHAKYENLRPCPSYKIINNQHYKLLSFKNSLLEPIDCLNMLGNKTDIYLDIYEEYSASFIWLIMACLFFITFVMFSIVFLCNNPNQFLLNNSGNIFSKMLLPILALSLIFFVIGVFLYYFKIPPEPKIRLNRQRKEVYVQEKSQSFFCKMGRYYSCSKNK